jgi:hypothetical protein
VERLQEVRFRLRCALTPAINTAYSDRSIRAVPGQEAANTGMATWVPAGVGGRGYVRALRKYSQYRAVCTPTPAPVRTGDGVVVELKRTASIAGRQQNKDVMG